MTFFHKLSTKFHFSKVICKISLCRKLFAKNVRYHSWVILKCTNGFLQKWQKSKDRKAQKYFWVRLSIRHAKSVSNYWCMGFNSVQLQFANLLKAFLLFVKLLWTTIIKNDSCTLLTMLNIHNNTSRISSENALQSHFWVNKVSLKPIFVPSKNQSMFLPTIWKIMI